MSTKNLSNTVFSLYAIGMPLFAKKLKFFIYFKGLY